MDSIKDDAFETASRRLERLAQLKEKNLLEETEYQNIRNNILSEMTSCTKFHEAKTPAVQKPTEPLESPSLSYGHLHSEIVRKIEATHKAAGENAKQRVFKAMTEMAEKQALYPGRLCDLVGTCGNCVRPGRGRRSYQCRSCLETPRDAALAD
jgi:hypothetical protein